MNFIKGGRVLSYSICKADFYYGAFLSVLINNGINPAIVENGPKRNIYAITTDKGDYKIYTKYVVNKNQKDTLWNIIFSTGEIQEINELIDKDNIIFVFICAFKKVKNNNTEIALLSVDDVRKCIDLSCTVNSRLRISIRKVKHSPNLWVYGTHRECKIGGSDNTIKIPRKRILEL